MLAQREPFGAASLPPGIREDAPVRRRLFAVALLLGLSSLFFAGCGEPTPDVHLLKLEPGGPTFWVQIEKEVGTGALTTAARTLRYMWKEGHGAFAATTARWGSPAQRQQRLRFATTFVFFYLPGMHADRDHAWARVEITPSLQARTVVRSGA